MGNPYLNPQPYYPGGGAPQMNDDVAHPGGHPSFTFGPNPYAGSAPQQNPGYGAVQRQQAPMIGGQTAPDNQGLVDALMAMGQRRPQQAPAQGANSDLIAAALKAMSAKPPVTPAPPLAAVSASLPDASY